MTPPLAAHPRTVVVCDDSPHLRQALTSLLQAYSRFHLVGQAIDGPTCLQVLADTRPDIVILDLRMPGGGAALVRAARTTCPTARIVMYSGHADPQIQQEMLAAGADAYAIKSGRLTQLIQALDGPAHAPAGTTAAVPDLDLGHTAHFLPDDDRWTTEFARYARTALTADGKLMIVASAAHRAALQTSIPDTLALAGDQGRVLIYAAEPLMELLIPDGRIDPSYFEHELRPAVENFITGTGHVFFWGEMVGLTWGTGNVAAAMELESLWNAMAADNPLNMKCPYPTATARPCSPADLAAVRRTHTHTLLPPTP